MTFESFKLLTMASIFPYDDNHAGTCGSSANIKRKRERLKNDPERKANLLMLEFAGKALLSVPSWFRYYQNEKDAEVVVFLPRYARVMLANAIAFMADLPEGYTKENLSGPIEFCGWKVIDGYENALVICTLRYSCEHPDFIFKVKLP